MKNFDNSAYSNIQRPYQQIKPEKKIKLRDTRKTLSYATPLQGLR
jgi:hypothetical protein